MHALWRFKQGFFRRKRLVLEEAICIPASFGRKTRDVLDLSSHWLAVFLVLSLVTLGLKIIYKE